MSVFLVLALAVFAIARRIHRRGRRNPLTYDLLRNPGETLHFPGWRKAEPIAQAKRQAQWLTNWLKSTHSIIKIGALQWTA